MKKGFIVLIPVVTAMLIIMGILKAEYGTFDLKQAGEKIQNNVEDLSEVISYIQAHAYGHQIWYFESNGQIFQVADGLTESIECHPRIKNDSTRRA